MLATIRREKRSFIQYISNTTLIINYDVNQLQQEMHVFTCHVKGSSHFECVYEVSRIRLYNNQFSFLRYKEEKAAENGGSSTTAGSGLKKTTPGGETPSTIIGIKRASTDQNDGANKRARGVTGQVCIIILVFMVIHFVLANTFVLSLLNNPIEYALFPRLLTYRIKLATSEKRLLSIF